jgi:hypothetical protein
MNGDFKRMQTYAVTSYVSLTTGYHFRECLTGYHLCNIPIHVIVIIIIIHNNTILCYITFQLMSKQCLYGNSFATPLFCSVATKTIKCKDVHILKNET